MPQTGKSWTRLLLTAAILLLGSGASAQAMVDLSAVDAYLRPGFKAEWTLAQPEASDKAWTRVAPHPGNRSLQYWKLPLAGGTQRSPLALGSQKADVFTVSFTVDIDPRLQESSAGLGLFLSDIGKNWNCYLNGTLIRSEVFLDQAGIITRERAIHGALIELDRRYLREGRNTISFEIYGDRGDYRTGLFSGGPYLIGDYQELLAFKGEYLDLMLIGVYILFSLYHLILFFLRPGNRPYLYYGLGTLFLAFYLFFRSYLVFNLMGDTAIIRGLELSTLFILVPLFFAFFDQSNRGKLTPFTLAFGALSLVMAFLSLFLWGEFILVVWQYLVILALAYLFVWDFVLPLATALGPKQGGSLAQRFKVLYELGDFWTIALAGVICVTCAVASLGDINSARALLAAKFAAFFVIFGAATILAARITGLFKDVEEFNAGLESRVRERTAALSELMEDQKGLNENLLAATSHLREALDANARDLKIAVQIQQGIFPQKAPELEDWEIAFVFLPVQGVSGDFFDFYVDEGRLSGTVVGDVSGHGIASGLITILARSIFYRSFRGLAKYSLGRILEEVNTELSAELSQVENYLTANLLRFDGPVVEYASAGHTELAYRRAGKAKANFITPENVGDFKGPPLGREGIEAPYHSLKFKVESGDSLFLYTDCLNEARNAEGQAFGYDGILSAYGRAPSDSAEEMLNYIIEDWRFHLDGAEVADDLTAVLLRRK